MTATTTVPSLEWSHADSHCNYLTSDLFGGDLFGDELIDMYSSVSDDGPELVSSAAIAGRSTLTRVFGADAGQMSLVKHFFL
jgi:hypothetical protein